MNRERLQHLKDVLKRVEAKRKPFDMNVWGEIRNDAVDRYKPTQAAECGFAGCALGYAGVDPQFVKEGLVAEQRDYVPDSLTVTYQGYRGYSAGTKFFGLSENEAHRLFNPHRYDTDPVTPRHVIERIDQLLERG